MNASTICRQRGLSITGLIFVLVILGFIGVLGLKIVPTVTEYMTIKKSIVAAKKAGNSIAEIRRSFDNQADVGYVTAITAKDLDIRKSDDGFDVSFAYEKKIPLIGPASLVIDYEGTTASSQPAKPLP